jgi:hypothetical protein
MNSVALQTRAQKIDWLGYAAQKVFFFEKMFGRISRRMERLSV